MTGANGPATAFRDEVWAGLSAPRRTLPCKYFYDARGSELFERICELEEYYLTRTEISILREHAGSMARALGPGTLLIEYGCGSAKKTRLLLERLERPAGYVPVDIAGEMLQSACSDLRTLFPSLPIAPVCADYTRPFALPPLGGRRAVFFPGSTVGNFRPEETRLFLRGVRATVGDGGALLLGVDLKKDPKVLEAAYDDRRGVTAAFNLNLLARINRELAGDFELPRWRHRALWNAAESRVEMHLVSAEDQVVHVAGREFRFRAGESIHTECCHKYDVEELRSFARAESFDLREAWTDPRRWFGVLLLRAS
jgi:dimethylhistidine N-methyltransferase